MNTHYAKSVPTREKVEDQSAIPKPPTSCGIVGCEAKTDVLSVVVLENGREKGGAFSDFGYTRPGDKGNTLHLRNEYIFVSWVPRCAHHHLRDLYRAGKGARSDLAKTDRISLADVVAYVPNPAWNAIGTPARQHAAGPTHVSAALPALRGDASEPPETRQ